MVGAVIFGVVAVFFALYVVFLYNRFVSLVKDAEAGFANIDVLLKQRHMETEKLVETCKRFMVHESEMFSMIANARLGAQAAERSGDVLAIAEKESHLTRGLGQLIALAESYPELKSDKVFVNLQMRVSALEESISDRQEFYNASVTSLNTAVGQFPSNLVAKVFGFMEKDLLEIEDQFKRNPNLSEMFTK